MGESADDSTPREPQLDGPQLDGPQLDGRQLGGKQRQFRRRKVAHALRSLSTTGP
ncbi:hypothetical protein [Streptomyces cavernicola]|uniref:Uncharacterized protein n=1 Tax=Streptomyces cavernicola TaxID=3043613 RepID=A0ABT6SFA5_9ACTN|nr:hypothetical protein [Streptomyces sp. B-S-A6]MDI3406866.1 hypothetical protein [Streptomyces sp. B-S-A6]